MKKISLIFIFFSLYAFSFLMQKGFASEFGKYQYTKYYAISQSLNNQRALNQARARRYNQNALRNIKYPTASNPYPNIQKSQPTRTLSARERYSSKYYQSL